MASIVREVTMEVRRRSSVLVLLAITPRRARPRRARREAAVAQPPKKKPPVEVAIARPPAPPAPPRPAATRADDGPLHGEDRRRHARRPRSAALRLTEEGRRRLAAGDPARAIELLERAIAVDARYRTRTTSSRRRMPKPTIRRSRIAFSIVPDRSSPASPYWRSRVDELRGKLLADEGKPAESEAAYRRASTRGPATARRPRP